MEVVGGREGARGARGAGRKGVRSSALHSQGHGGRSLLCRVRVWQRLLGWELLGSGLRPAPEGCDSVPGENWGWSDATAEGAECPTDRVSLGATRSRGSHQGSCPSPTLLCSCTPAMGLEPSLHRQALSLYCPAKMQLQPHDGSSVLG